MQDSTQWLRVIKSNFNLDTAVKPRYDEDLSPRDLIAGPRKQFYRSCLTGCLECVEQLLFIFLICFLTACSSFTTQKSSHSQAYQLLESAQKFSYPERATYEIEAVGLLLNNRSYTSAEKLLRAIPETQLTPTLLTQKRLQYARFFVLTRKSKEATQILNQIASPETLEPREQVLYHQLYADKYELAGNYIESARTRVWLEGLLTSQEQIYANRDKLWQVLLRASPDVLKAAISAPPPDIFSGWLNLAEIQLRYSTQVSELVSRVQAWQKAYSTHPANARLPEPIGLYMRTPSVYPPKIALLLPLQGQLEESALALQNGFFSAFYELRNSSVTLQPNIQIYDSTKDTIRVMYDRAIAEGASLVVGPLTKPELEKLVAENALSVPTIALNYLPEDKQSLGASTPHLYQFGLSPEDEMAQVADMLYQRGHQKPLLIVPNDPLGKRAAAIFLKKSRSYQKEPVAIFEFNPSADISAQMYAQFKVYEQQAELPYDSVALLAFPPEARQIKPLLNYYFSEGLPIYATSHVFSGMASDTEDGDLEGIYFCDIPWLVQRTSEQPPLPENEHFRRLFALGYDAFHLVPYVDQLNSAEFTWFGLTGQLKPISRTIHRQLSWAQFKGGRPVPLD